MDLRRIIPSKDLAAAAAFPLRSNSFKRISVIKTL